MERALLRTLLTGAPEGTTENSALSALLTALTLNTTLKKEEDLEEDFMEALEPGFLQAKLREYEVRLIREALQRARGNQAQAARILGLPPTTLASQLRRLGIEAREFKRHISPEWPLVS